MCCYRREEVEAEVRKRFKDRNYCFMWKIVERKKDGALVSKYRSWYKWAVGWNKAKPPIHNPEACIHVFITKEDAEEWRRIGRPSDWLLRVMVREEDFVLARMRVPGVKEAVFRKVKVSHGEMVRARKEEIYP